MGLSLPQEGHAQPSDHPFGERIQQSAMSSSVPRSNISPLSHTVGSSPAPSSLAPGSPSSRSRLSRRRQFTTPKRYKRVKPEVLRSPSRIGSQPRFHETQKDLLMKLPCDRVPSPPCGSGIFSTCDRESLQQSRTSKQDVHSVSSRGRDYSSRERNEYIEESRAGVREAEERFADSMRTFTNSPRKEKGETLDQMIERQMAAKSQDAGVLFFRPNINVFHGPAYGVGALGGGTITPNLVENTNALVPVSSPREAFKEERQDVDRFDVGDENRDRKSTEDKCFERETFTNTGKLDPISTSVKNLEDKINQLDEVVSNVLESRKRITNRESLDKDADHMAKISSSNIVRIDLTNYEDPVGVSDNSRHRHSTTMSGVNTGLYGCAETTVCAHEDNCTKEIELSDSSKKGNDESCAIEVEIDRASGSDDTRCSDAKKVVISDGSTRSTATPYATTGRSNLTNVKDNSIRTNSTQSEPLKSTKVETQSAPADKNHTPGSQDFTKPNAGLSNTVVTQALAPTKLSLPDDVSKGIEDVSCNVEKLYRKIGEVDKKLNDAMGIGTIPSHDPGECLIVEDDDGLKEELRDLIQSQSSLREELELIDKECGLKRTSARKSKTASIVNCQCSHKMGKNGKFAQSRERKHHNSQQHIHSGSLKPSPISGKDSNSGQCSKYDDRRHGGKVTEAAMVDLTRAEDYESESLSDGPESSSLDATLPRESSNQSSNSSLDSKQHNTPVTKYGVPWMDETTDPGHQKEDEHPETMVMHDKSTADVEVIQLSKDEDDNSDLEEIEIVFVEDSFLSTDHFAYGDAKGYVFDWIQIGDKNMKDCNKYSNGVPRAESTGRRVTRTKRATESSSYEPKIDYYEDLKPRYTNHGYESNYRNYDQTKATNEKYFHKPPEIQRRSRPPFHALDQAQIIDLCDRDDTGADDLTERIISVPKREYFAFGTSKASRTSEDPPGSSGLHASGQREAQRRHSRRSSHALDKRTETDVSSSGSSVSTEPSLWKSGGDESREESEYTASSETVFRRRIGSVIRKLAENNPAEFAVPDDPRGQLFDTQSRDIPNSTRTGSESFRTVSKTDSRVQSVSSNSELDSIASEELEERLKRLLERGKRAIGRADQATPSSVRKRSDSGWSSTDTETCGIFDQSFQSSPGLDVRTDTFPVRGPPQATRSTDTLNQHRAPSHRRLDRLRSLRGNIGYAPSPSPPTSVLEKQRHKQRGDLRQQPGTRSISKDKPDVEVPAGRPFATDIGRRFSYSSVSTLGSAGPSVLGVSRSTRQEPPDMDDCNERSDSTKEKCKESGKQRQKLAKALRRLKKGIDKSHKKLEEEKKEQCNKAQDCASPVQLPESLEEAGMTKMPRPVSRRESDSEMDELFHDFPDLLAAPASKIRSPCKDTTKRKSSKNQNASQAKSPRYRTKCVLTLSHVPDFPDLLHPSLSSPSSTHSNGSVRRRSPKQGKDLKRSLPAHAKSRSVAAALPGSLLWAAITEEEEDDASWSEANE